MPANKGVIHEYIVQHGDQKSAVTHYQVEQETDVTIDNEVSEIKSVHLSLVRLVLETGRMHQIRIHLAKNNCPIAGDDQHGNFKVNKILKKACGIKRLQLAAVRLTVPLDVKERTFEIPNPLNFSAFQN